LYPATDGQQTGNNFVDGNNQQRGLTLAGVAIMPCIQTAHVVVRELRKYS